MKHRAAVIGLCLITALLFTCSASAATLYVGVRDSLQAAIDAAQPGDTILVDPRAVFTGTIRLRAKTGTDKIVIRSAAPDSSLPPAGQRIDPSYSKFLPKIRGDHTGPALKAENHAANYVLMFLEFFPVSSKASVNLIEFGAGSSSQSTLSTVPHDIVMDRCYVHGNARYGHRRGVALNSASTSIVNSYFEDFKGVLQDTQAIMGWNGPGPFLIENNYLEGAAENIMFGGSDPSIPDLIPSDIVIRRNLISKPTEWKSQRWTVKNLIELKNAQRVTIEGNVIENNWASGQQGYAIVLTPRNQSGSAPWSTVRDVTIRNNVIRHVAAALNINGYDNLEVSGQVQDVEIRNNLFYDVSPSWSTLNKPANGQLAHIGGGPKNITFDHNTVDNAGDVTIFFYGGFSRSGTAITGFELTNNLLRDNEYGIFADGASEGTVGLNKYTPNAIVLRNTFAGGAAKSYPTGNDFPALRQWVTDFISRRTADYRLQATSLSKAAGTDGKDLGVDFVALNAALTGAPPSPDPPPDTPPPVTDPPPPGDTRPFTGAPIPLPGTVQFENYDTGGSDVAYHDTTIGNAGGAYRSNHVDIQASTDAGGGYHLAYVAAREWLKYSVTVAATGTYAIDVRVASKSDGGTFHMEVDGADVTGGMTVPMTGAWTAWTTITKAGVALSAGPHVIRVVMDAPGRNGASVANFNWFAVRPY